MTSSPYLVKPGKKVDLKKWPSDDTGNFDDKHQAHHPIERNLTKLKKLQDVLYADARHALLVVLQAMDAGGKDGAIEHVFSGVNPQGCEVTSFKAPTDLELHHDFLWRIHDAAPRKGMIGIFNRSHYESVLIERVKDLVPKKVWSRRYDHINAFEQMLADEGTVILKFYLHISAKEQKQRLQERLDDPSKNWKFDEKDLVERKHWDAYTKAYEDLLTKCSTEAAPWYVVPADHKWYRNWVISDTIVRTLQDLKLKYPAPTPNLKNLKVD